uniref:Uncharacterized protein n=1 Tax=Anguilla anguilla TaxID=7936 RepID=A0A0E9R2W6_ANGAN
MSRPLLCRTM